MHVLITGGAGFIGSHLTEALLQRGDTVSVFDNLSTGAAANIQGLQGHPRFTFVMASLDDAAALNEIAGRADAIVHLAAAVGVQLILEHPTQTIETNVLGTHALLAAARQYGCHTLIASSSEVYGKSRSLPYSESDDLILGPPNTTRWVLCRHQAARRVSRARRPPGVRTSRLQSCASSTSLGRGNPAVLVWFCQGLSGQALRGQPVTVYGDGMQTSLLLSRN